MKKLQKTEQGLARSISKDLLKISPSDFHLAYQEKIDRAREQSKTKDEYETKLVVISQQRALAKAEIEMEWIDRCQTPKNTKKELVGVTTLDAAISLAAPSLRKVGAIKGEGYVLAYIASWVVDLQYNLNIKNKMSESMIDEVAVTILNTFGYLTIPDIKNVFTDALNGVYGEFYESLSIPKVVGWFREYAERRMSEFEARNYSDHAHYKGESAGWTDRERIATLSAEEMLDIEKGLEKK